MNTLHQVQYVALDQFEGYKNPRSKSDEKANQGLQESIRQIGIRIPILATPGERKPFRLLDGHRRWHAAKAAGLDKVPVIALDKPLSEEEWLLHSLTVNCQREDLSPIDKALAIEVMKGAASWSTSDAAVKLGLSIATITKLLKLLELPAAIQARVQAGEIPASTAYELTKVEDAERQARLADAAAKGQLTRDSASAAARPDESGIVPKKGPALSRVRVKLGCGQSVSIAGPDLSLEKVVECLDGLLKQAKKACRQGVQLPCFVRLLNKPHSSPAN